MKAIVRSHPFAIVFFVPFALLLYIHESMGLSDAMFGPVTPGQPHSLLYNVVMVLSFFFGVSGYVLHALAIAKTSVTAVSVKLLLLAVSWTTLVLVV